MSKDAEAVKRVAAYGGIDVRVSVDEKMDGSDHEYAGVIEDNSGRSLFRVRLPYNGLQDLLRIYMFRPADGVIPDQHGLGRHREAALAYFANHPQPPSDKDLGAAVEECCADGHK
jgi:hypothetical protein